MSAPVLPSIFLERMSDILKEDFPLFIASLENSRVNGIRVNTLKISPEKFKERWPHELIEIPWSEEGFIYDYKTQPGQHPYHYAGVYYLQEPSAMAAIHYLDPQPGELILDLAAAPGGKSTAIAARMNNKGLLWANEIHPGRARILAQNLDRWGSHNTIVSNESPDKLAKHLPQFFDRILLDAPCSGEGMFRKDPSAIKEWSPEHVQACAKRQSLILESAASLLKPGGRLVYSTCTFSPEENEETILHFLHNHPEFQPVSIPDPTPDFIHPTNLPEAVRLYPHKVQGEGHFIIALQKNPNANTEEEQTKSPYYNPNKPSSKKQSKRSQYNVKSQSKGPRSSQIKGKIQDPETLFKEFLNTELRNLPFFYKKANSHNNTDSNNTYSNKTNVLEENSSNLLAFGNHLYYSPDPTIPLKGLTILRPGLHLGEIRPGRFQPGQAFAHALNPNSVNQYLSLSPSDPQILSYLRGETLHQEGPDGWVLVGVEEFPLGWAKRIKGELKNHYPKELRVTNY